MATVVIKDPLGQPTSVHVSAQGATAGRTPDNAIQLHDGRCSRKHFSLERRGNEWWLADLGSANGTFVNGQRIAQPQLLEHGDVITAGDLELLFLNDDSSALFGPESTPARGADVIVRSVDEMAAMLQGGVLNALAGLKEPPPATSTAAATAPVMQGATAFAVLAQLSRVILSAATSKELLESAVDLIFQVMRVQRVAVFLLDDAQRPKLSVHRAMVQEKEFTVSSTILERAIRERVAISSGDARHDPRFSAGQSIAAWDIRSVLCVPLWAESEVYGVLYIDNLKQQHAFTEPDLELATGVANLVAIGLKQQQLKETIKDEAVMRSNLERYHSPDVVNLILNRRGLEGSMQAAAEMEATILFTDIKGFTPLSERLRPSELAELLNWYFDLMTRVIFKHKGSVNKFIGDAIMAIFGAPIAHGNDAVLAVTAATEMLKALEDFTAHLDERKRFEIRIGINTGPVIAGDIGARNRMEYTVIGDAVNTAQRLESICRPNAVTVGKRTFELVRDQFKFHDLGERTLKGKTDTVRAYEVIPDDDAR
jgi:adenylate cyclase